MEPFPAGVGELFHDRAGNLRDVDLTLRKAWHMYREHIDPIIEIGPECTFIDTRLDVLVRGADQSEVDLDFMIAAHPLNLAVFKNAQELGLQWQRHVTDFVKEQRAALGKLHPSLTGLVGTGERAFLMAENFRFEQFGWYGGAIHRHEPATATGCLVNGTRDEFFAGTRFTENKHAGWRARHDIDQIFQLFGRR